MLLRTALTRLELKSLWRSPTNGQGNTKIAPGDRAPISALSAVSDPPRDRNSRSLHHNPAPTRRKPSTEETSLKSTGGWWAGQDSNLQPDRYERPALTVELLARRGRLRALTANPGGWQGNRPAGQSRPSARHYSASGPGGPRDFILLDRPERPGVRLSPALTSPRISFSCSPHGSEHQAIEAA